VPITVYVVGPAPGEAITTLPFVVFKPAAGLHVYVLAPFTVMVTEVLVQIDALFTVTVGDGLTVTVEVPGIAAHVPTLPVTV
jgi:hypothetical protein